MNVVECYRKEKSESSGLTDCVQLRRAQHRNVSKPNDLRRAAVGWNGAWTRTLSSIAATCRAIQACELRCMPNAARKDA
jgi:hypothetical protein